MNSSVGQVLVPRLLKVVRFPSTMKIHHCKQHHTRVEGCDLVEILGP